MQVKDMCLKKSSLHLILLTIIFFFSNHVAAKEVNKENLTDYLENLKLFSASFIQNSEEQISEGKIYIGTNRIRVEYETPSKILIILDQHKAMYYNYDLEEDEFFNPKDTAAWFFSDIFNDPKFFFNKKTILEQKDNYISLQKKGFNNQDEEYNIVVYFENNPIILRKIILSFEDNELVISLFNHKFNEIYEKNFFKLINPNFFN